MKHMIKIITVDSCAFEVELESEEEALKAFNKFVNHVIENRSAIEITNALNSSKTTIFTKHILAIDYKQEETDG